MNVSFHPQAAAHRPASAPAPRDTNSQAAQSAPAAGDEIQLSAAAQQLLSAQHAGKAQAGTPAALAAAYLATEASAASATDATGQTDGTHQPFGQTVRNFTPGHLKQAAAAAALAADSTDPTAVQDGTGQTQDAPAGDGGDVANVPADESADGTASEPDIGALLNDSESPAEDAAVDESDAAAATAQDTTGTEQTASAGDPAADPAADPVAGPAGDPAIDPTAELLDQLLQDAGGDAAA